MGDEFGGDSPVSSSAQDEKIFVSVRIRPLNEKEISRRDISEWDCINNTTLIFKSNVPERSSFLPAYKFDRVFGCGCSTKQVYDEGAKEVALSVVSGINSSIFAYGQTSSGKTYTMSGVTGYAVADIYDYIERHKEREFVSKFSAMEIYNEAVRDLLSSDSTQLRLLDDPERGTVVERLTEETLRDHSHLMELLSICDAQRQIGETSLNETSSRSHQILRLTIESSACKFSRTEDSSTLSATVNFIDLAGSERASQTNSAGTRLKEGCHINRSLLTLGTVIRKLSKGRNGHVPYRDSKLTRILQNSLGGNARTAIICTLSPARSHVEQSRNTLLFATCAKEVATNAQVNVVMSDKVLLKHLQRELGRLENELRNSASNSDSCEFGALLKEKEFLIEEMDKEIKELIQQRDLAQSRVEDLLRTQEEDQVSRPVANSVQNARVDDYSALESSNVADPCHLPVNLRTVNAPSYFDRCNGLNSNQEYLPLPENSEEHFLNDGISPRLSTGTPHFVGPDPCQGWEEIIQKTSADSEDICKEVQCIETEGPIMNIKTKADSFSPGPDENGGKLAMAVSENVDEISSPQKADSHNVPAETYDALKQKIQEMQHTINCFVGLHPVEQSPYSPEGYMSSSRSLKLARSTSCRADLMNVPSPTWFPKSERDENTASNGFEKDYFQLKLNELKYGANIGKLSRKSSQTSFTSMDEKAHDIKTFTERNIAIAHDVVAGANEMTKIQSEKQFGIDVVLERRSKKSELGINVDEVGPGTTQSAMQSPAYWPLEFERQQREIIELWNACKVPLVHRTYFFLLFKGDPSDSVYMEVELRRLSFLKDKFSQGTTTVKGGQTLSLPSSIRALNRERMVLSKRMRKRFAENERESLYQKWGIMLNSKQRRLQLASFLWTDTRDMGHIMASAAIVAKLVGFVEQGDAPKEMFGLSFAPKAMNWRSQSWRHSLSSIL